MTMRRKFPAPWTARQTPGGFSVEDATGTPLVYLYARTEREQSASARHSALSWEEAERLATFIATVPERIKKATPP